MDTFLAIGRQGNVGVASVLAAKGPFCLAVAYDEDSWSRHGERLCFSKEAGCEDSVSPRALVFSCFRVDAGSLSADALAQWRCLHQMRGAAFGND